MQLDEEIVVCFKGVVEQIENLLLVIMSEVCVLCDCFV